MIRLQATPSTGLAKSFFVRASTKQAAASFLKGYQTYGKGSKAPDSLLKLAMSLDRLGQKEAACSSYGELNTRFPTPRPTSRAAPRASASASPAVERAMTPDAAEPIRDDELDELFGGLAHGPLALAVSGGADSMTLMRLIARWAARPSVKAKWSEWWAQAPEKSMRPPTRATTRLSRAADSGLAPRHSHVR